MLRTIRSYVRAAGARDLYTIWALGLAATALAMVLPSQVGGLTTLFASAPGPTWPAVQRAVLLLVGAQAAMSVLAYWRRRLEFRLRERLTRSIALDVYSRLVRSGPEFFRDADLTKISVGVLDDVRSVGEVWTTTIVGGPLAVVSILIFAVAIVFANWVLALVVIPLALLSAYFVIFDARIQRTSRRARETWEDVQSRAHELVSVVPELRTHNAFDYGQGRLRDAFDRWAHLMVEAGRLTAIFRATEPLVDAVQAGALYAIGGALCLGALGGIGGGLTWGDVVKVALLAPLFHRPVNDLAGQVLGWRMTLEAARRVQAHLARPLAFASVPGAPVLHASSGIVLRDVALDTASGIRLLDGVNVHIGAAEHVALCGPAGSGKSTVVRLMVGDLAPTLGDISFGGVPLAQADQASVAREIGWVPQKAMLIDASIRDNLLLGLRRPSARTIEDEGGAIDVSSFLGVVDRASLDLELLTVVRQVGLEMDVLRKALNVALVAGVDPLGELALRKSLQDIRQRCHKALSSREAVVIPFHGDAVMPGTIGENIFGPGSCRKEVAEVYAREVVDRFAGTPVFSDLIAIGERLAAVKSERECLIAALTADADLARIVPPFEGWDAAAAQARVLAARRVVRAGDGTLTSWTAMDDSFDARLTLRDVILGGRVNPRVHRSAEQVDAAIHRSLAAVGVLDSLLVRGLDASVGRDGRFLSEGQKQKVALARVLLKRPSVLLLDEATASLDNASQNQIVKTLRQTCRDRTIVAVSHRLSTIRDYDRIAVFDRGQLVEQGTFDVLIERNGLFRLLVEHHSDQEGSLRPSAASAATSPSAPWLNARGIGWLHARLAQSAIFSHLPSDHLSRLGQRARLVECEPGEIVFSRGESGTELAVILEGEIEFIDDRRSPSLESGSLGEVVATYGPGRVFGEVALFGGGIRTLTARATSATALALVGRDDLVELIKADGEVAVAFLQGLAELLAQATEHPRLSRASA